MFAIAILFVFLIVGAVFFMSKSRNSVEDHRLDRYAGLNGK